MEVITNVKILVVVETNKQTFYFQGSNFSRLLGWLREHEITSSLHPITEEE